jgi:hypothetical protein
MEEDKLYEEEIEEPVEEHSFSGFDSGFDGIDFERVETIQTAGHKVSR